MPIVSDLLFRITCYNTVKKFQEASPWTIGIPFGRSVVSAWQRFDVGSSGDWISQGYDALSTVFLLINLAVTLMDTFDKLSQYHNIFIILEGITVTFLPLIMLCAYGQQFTSIPTFHKGKLSKSTSFPSPALLTYSPSFPISCPLSSPPVLRPSVCSVWFEFSACFKSILTIIPST